MITSAKYVNYIVETINVLRQEIISKNKLGLNDENIYMENFICDLLNMCYGYDLVNLNENKSNYPGIDLGDKKRKLGFQITSTKSSRKINDTLKKCIENDSFLDFPKVKFFIITERQKKYSVTVDYQETISFDEREDILDFDSLYIRIMYLDILKQKAIAEYVHRQIPNVSSSLGIDYYATNMFKRLEEKFLITDWIENEDGFMIEIEHNFSYKPQVSIIDSEGNEHEFDVVKNEKKVTIKSSKRLEGTIILS